MQREVLAIVIIVCVSSDCWLGKGHIAQAQTRTKPEPGESRRETAIDLHGNGTRFLI